MPRKVIIRQLWDKQKRKTPTVGDIERNLLINKKTENYDGKEYITYQNKEDEKPYQNQGHVTWKNLTENYRYKLPTKFINNYSNSRKRVVNRPKLLHDLFQFQEKFDKLGGEGYYNIYTIGGRNPSIRYILQAWLYRDTA